MKLLTQLKALAFGVAALGFVATGASAGMLEDIKAAGKITFGTEMHYAPFDMLIDGEYAGISKDLMDQVASDLGVEAMYQDLPWSSVLPGLEAKKFDMVNAPVTITAERMKRYDFTLPIADATVALIKRAGDESISKPQDIAGKTVGAQKGSAQLEQLKEFAASIGGTTEVKEYSSVDEAYADLVAGRLDAVANSFPNLGYLAKQRPETFETVLPAFGKKKYFAWVARKGSERLIAAINKIILKMHDDGRLAAVHEKWLGKAIDLPTTMPEL